MIHELERSADLMVNVAVTTTRLYPVELDLPSRALVCRMANQVTVQIRLGVNAFVDLDPAAAAALADMDDTTDELHKALLRHLVEVEGDDCGDDLLRAVQLALVAHHYERIGDHAVNVAEQVYRVVRGHRRAVSRPRRSLAATAERVQPPAIV